MTCITFETLNSENQDWLAGRSLRRAASGRTMGAAPQGPLGHKLVCATLRLISAPIRVYSRWRANARVYADFGMIDLRTLDDIGLVRNHVAAVGTPDNEDAPRGNVA